MVKLLYWRCVVLNVTQELLIIHSFCPNILCMHSQGQRRLLVLWPWIQWTWRKALNCLLSFSSSALRWESYFLIIFSVLDAELSKFTFPLRQWFYKSWFTNVCSFFFFFFQSTDLVNVHSNCYLLRGRLASNLNCMYCMTTMSYSAIILLCRFPQKKKRLILI